MSKTERALRVIKNGRPFSFVDGGFAFTGVRLGREVIVPYHMRVLYVVGVRVSGSWADPADAVPTALRRRKK